MPIVEITFAGMVYFGSLMNCYDGDTCKIHLHNVPPFLRVWDVRFAGFDTPEIKGKCAAEKKLAREAQKVTEAYMKQNPRLDVSEEKIRGKYGRLLVKAPELKSRLLKRGLAKPYKGGRRESWCPTKSS